MEEQQTQRSDAFEQLEILLESIEQHPDENVRNHVRALVFSLLDLHHAAISKMLKVISEHDAKGEIFEEFSNDEVIRAILMVQDLMPESLEKRIENALDEARKKLSEYDADVELVKIEDNTAYLKLFGGGASMTVSTAVLKAEIEHFLHEFTPDLFNVKYDDTIAPPKQSATLVQIQPFQPKQEESDKKIMLPVIRADQVKLNSKQVIESGDDINLLVCNIAGTFYAFENRCPHQNQTLGEGLLEGGVLTCPWHGYQFDIKRGGRCLTDPSLKLESLPLKVENEVIKVNLKNG